MTRSPDHQPAIVLRDPRERARHRQRADIALIGDEIRDALAALAQGGRTGPGTARAWVIRAQAARRAKLRALRAASHKPAGCAKQRGCRPKDRPTRPRDP